MKLPKICPLSVIRPWMVATVSTRLSRITAMGLPMFAPVRLPNLMAPARFIEKPMAGRLFSSTEARALLRSRPVTGATLRTR